MLTEDDLRRKIDAYLAPLLHEYQQILTRRSDSKIIRDSIWGFSRYKPYQMAVIDSPPFQRLRNISQTSLARFTYPCAVHSRFEHSLGTASVASRMLDAVERTRSLPAAHPTLRTEVELAALLHDIGHGPLSHSSEKFFETLEDSDGDAIFSGPNSLPEQDSMFAESNAGEILSYLIVTSLSFQKLWKRIVELCVDDEPALRSVDLHRVGSMILGVDDRIGADVRFYRQIVNGPFDADKIDYITRDAHYTGLDIAVDIGRLLNTICVVSSGSIAELGILISGASVLEQLIFSKTQLYSSMYHHHKVRAAHHLFTRLLYTMKERGYKPAGHDLGEITAYIALDDQDLLCAGHDDPDIARLVGKIKHRILPKRALVMNYPCFEEEDNVSRENFSRIGPLEARQIERSVEKAEGLADGSVIFDLPDPPRLFGTARAAVQLAPGRQLALEMLYPAGAWANAFMGYRRSAYVFTDAVDRRAVGVTARRVLSELNYPVVLNDNSLALAKHE